MKINLETIDNLDSIVSLALAEDIGSGDINAELIPSDKIADAHILTRETGILCGRPWVDAVFLRLDPKTVIQWHFQEGDEISPNDVICDIKGNTRALLTGERTALNFLQTLSGTATTTHHYAAKLKGLHTQLLDTRKTLPGLREAQKYAVRMGGGHNHRMGLYDAFLIKENHIAASGSLTEAVKKARMIDKQKKLEVEVESFPELEEALRAKVNWILCDNFSLSDLREAIRITAGRAKLEASGNITLENMRDIAETGVDYISMGTLTKNMRALDLSMRFL